MKMKANCWYCIVLLVFLQVIMMMMMNTMPIVALAAFEEYNNASDVIGRYENWLLASTLMARKRCGRIPTPSRYLGARTFHSRRQSPSASPYYRSCYRSSSYTWKISPLEGWNEHGDTMIDIEKI
ncbi:uncharacterized protein LOC120264297 isoform X1 [Dioscorea cayenensis subsp. rotundata]|uniref:Uncharacterized protein LOC120264297 isoform X1 n=2 Tax=Dioscorea cayennensis subsp. rotundata TaxID=55577 RepID=A0AB40BL12_DIOCR|nr:uncharacterized protein LOC120264297 isoform X1 [Dioscorea cayenensis subsp. rotundata]XP_039128031.1 uncharacterized protein LOC120264297 isoform X1 [Dioscorea cayenensis subsp. rotundata]XP_039128032.1 uncharacterized protein LOC120264297 isoform X1 [Dioscorea cayenensis subsp. rotundata]XP_039128033.1 uncharacterized protein LOC120264297 isoform X1 [Dioscorea cayenensis subsp. rotundata]